MSSTRSWARGWICAADLPDVSNISASLEASLPATAVLLCMGLFLIFWLGARPAPVSRLSFPVMMVGWLAKP